MIDKLEYSYNGNQLLKVKDVSKNTKGYPSILEHHEIEYDDNGNMTKHLDKEIHLVTYNFLNLPQQLINGRGEYHYNYRSDGVKVRETNYYYDNAYTSDYLDNFKYKTYLRGEDREAALLFAHTSEGYYDFVKNSYIYNYVDHLGNVRLSYSDNNKDGEIDASSEIIEENNYYPFGLKHEGYNSLAGYRSYQ